MRPELTRQHVQQPAQLGIGITLELIGWLDQAETEEPRPDPVHDRSGEIRVFR